MQRTILILMLILTSLISSAQLRGSGKTITKTYDYKNFDKVNFKDLDGKIDVEIGKSWSITVTIDDNLLTLLSFKENPAENELTVFFKGNSNNKMYIEATNLKIRITMPEASVVVHDGNSYLEVGGLIGRYFRVENRSNASTKLSGSIDDLDIMNAGNGNVDAENLISKTAKVKSIGNGNAKVNVTSSIVAIARGNGSVFNRGKAPFTSSSESTGNGRLINH